MINPWQGDGSARLSMRACALTGGWHGWKLHPTTSVAAVWIPLAADFTLANGAVGIPADQVLSVGYEAGSLGGRGSG